MFLLAVGQFLFSALALLVSLFIIVVIHELGHFLMARWCGVKVDTFSIGFGREIYGWDDRKGTHWRIAIILLGGYVKFAGDNNVSSFPDQAALEKAKSQHGYFHAKPIWQRMLVTAAGPMANFILAIVIFAGVYMVVGKPYLEPRIGEVVAGSMADKAGLKPGDLIAAINDTPIDSFQDVVMTIFRNGDRELVVNIKRDDQPMTIRVTPTMQEESDNFGGTYKKGLLGISSVPGSFSLVKLSLPEAVLSGITTTGDIIKRTIAFIGDLVTGRQNTIQVGSVISMGKMIGDAASLGFADYVFRVALLSVSIGLLNLFPIPVLDGGHLVFYTLELIRGKPLSPKAMEWGFRVGLFLLIIFMGFAMMNDLTRSINVIRGG